MARRSGGGERRDVSRAVAGRGTLCVLPTRATECAAFPPAGDGAHSATRRRSRTDDATDRRRAMNQVTAVSTMRMTVTLPPPSTETDSPALDFDEAAGGCVKGNAGFRLQAATVCCVCST